MAVHELFAYLCVRNTAEAIEFYRHAFGATEKFRLTEPSGRIGHAEVDFGGTTLMLCDEFPEYGIRAPQSGAGTSVTIHIHVDNADAVIQQAVERRRNPRGAALRRVLRRALRVRPGSLRPPLEHRTSHRGRVDRRDAAPLFGTASEVTYVAEAFRPFL
jgi:PhnB protein